jgi:hypothetical protein
MTQHSSDMRGQWHRLHIEIFEYLREFEFAVGIFEKALAP